MKLMLAAIGIAGVLAAAFGTAALQLAQFYAHLLGPISQVLR